MKRSIRIFKEMQASVRCPVVLWKAQYWFANCECGFTSTGLGFRYIGSRFISRITSMMRALKGVQL